MHSYYAETLSGVRLRRCYELAPRRVQQYLEAEIEFVVQRIEPTHRVLELGCGYGRVLARLAASAAYVVGVDTSLPSLQLARQLLSNGASYGLTRMDAGGLGVRDAQFDMVVCIQNGAAVFGVDPGQLAGEAARVARRGGTILMSSYAAGFWEHRLEWFRIQAEHGLVGEIDESRTGNGVIICRDGFAAGVMTPEDFQRIAARCELECRITEIDGSSLMCEMAVA